MTDLTEGDVLQTPDGFLVTIEVDHPNNEIKFKYFETLSECGAYLKSIGHHDYQETQ